MEILLPLRERSQFSETFTRALSDIGSLTIREHCDRMPDSDIADMVRSTRVLLTSHFSPVLPEELAENPGQLEFICHIHGSIRKYIPRKLIEAGITVSNWGPGPGFSIARSAMTLLLAVVSGLPARLRIIREGGWREDVPDMPLGYLENCRVGIYGFGVVGRRFAEMLRPFNCAMTAYDPFVETLPEDIAAAGSLEELCRNNDILVIHAGLSDETAGTVNQHMLSLLPDYGIIINTARGDIIDQDALFRELESGRLRAGLDVFADDDAALEKNHPLRLRDNCVITCHRLSNQGSFRKPAIIRYEEIALENLRLFFRGEVPRYTFSPERYDLST